MQRVIKPWLAFCLSLGVFASCSQDKNEPSSSAQGGERVTLGLYAEVSVEDPSLRSIIYKLGKNSKDQLVPMPQFSEGQIVDVHTIIKSSNGVYGVQTLKWRYNSKSKKLVLSPTNSQDGNNIVIDNFNNDGATKWYISGLIGGTLRDTQVTFEGERLLHGVLGNENDIVSNLNVPYAFGWTELTINTQKHTNTKESNGSYKYAEVPLSVNVKFTPLGSLIAYKLGTEQKAGEYTFTPRGFMVNSNAFGDKGTFELNTDTPTNSASTTVLPTWKEGIPSSLVYRFALGQEPGTIEHGKRADKTYYAWVMPHTTQPTEVSTRVMLRGSSSRPETDVFKDYTNVWFTDYVVKSSRLTPGKVHQLKANASYPLCLPIQYVTDYNLAGGEGLSTRPEADKFQPVGVMGSLRFANSHGFYDGHRNDASGYYSWFKIVGRRDDTYNPDGWDLQGEVKRLLGEQYFIPTQELLWGIFPSHQQRNWATSDQYNLNVEENMAFGSGYDFVRQSYSSDYRNDVTPDQNNEIDTYYAIRFKASTKNEAVKLDWDVDYDTGAKKSYTYPPATDNLLKCAYRFRRIGLQGLWDRARSSRNISNRDFRDRVMLHQVIVDVVYLGEEDNPTELSTISSPQWWDDKKNEGMVISKTFPAAGRVGLEQHVISPGAYVCLSSSSCATNSKAWGIFADFILLSSEDETSLDVDSPVRLFQRLNP